MESEEAYRPHPSEVASAASAASDGIVVVTVSDAIGHAGVGPLVQALNPGRLTDRSCVVVDMQHVPFMDSSGINAFLSTHRDLTRAEGRLRLPGVPDSVRRTLQRVGVDVVVPCCPGLREALAV
ncbi:STAS domain-containing protein [Streptomyces populi]